MAHRISKKDRLLFIISVHSECSFAELLITGCLHTEVSTKVFMSATSSEYGIPITKGDRITIT